MPHLTWGMKDGTWEITSLTFLPESEKNSSSSREHRFICSHCGGSKHPHCTPCVGNSSFSYAAHPDTQKISRCFTHTAIWHYDHHQSLYHFPSLEPALPAKLISNTDWLGLVCTLRSSPLHSLQCWRANTASFFLPNRPFLIQFYRCLDHCNGPFPTVTLQATSTETTLLLVTPGFWSGPCCLWSRKPSCPLHSSAAHFFPVLLQQGLSECCMQKEIIMMWRLTGDCRISAVWIAPLCRMSDCTCSIGSTCSSLHQHAQGWEFYWHTPQLGTTEMQLC